MSDAVMLPSASQNFCDNITLSEFNKIQPHGGLLVLDKNLHIVQCSENMATILDTPIDKLLNLSVYSFLESENPDENITALLNNKSNKYKRIDWRLSKNKIKIWMCVHQVSEGTIMEIEPHIENYTEENTLFDLMQHAVDGMKLISCSQNLQVLIQNACDEVQKITGFDRVMVYQFDEHNDSGVVVGETIVDGMESYLGLHFPATDVPLNVRAMYLNIPVRHIPSINYKPEKIIPEINPVSGTYLDLSNSGLRMVAPVHIKYMKNMDVVASTSVAIIHNNKLWGLIACHHKKPKYLSVNLRLILMLIGNTLGIQVASLVCSKEYVFEQKTAENLSTLTENIYKEESLLYALDGYHKNMIELVGAVGMSVYYHNNILSYGETPTQDQVMTLIQWLKNNPIHSYFSSSSLPLIFKPSRNYKNTACGVLVVPLTQLQSHYIIFYRPEIARSLFWAGNPALSLKIHGDQYSPRDSFERFKQTISNHSAPWTPHDIKTAEFIRSAVVNKQLQDLLQVQAMHDPLTGLLNRLYLDQRLELELNRVSRKSQNLAIILTDLDFFKKINDNFGHQAGDYVLSEFAQFLKKCFRGYDYIYRYGGEEFLILLPDTDDIGAQKKAEILRAEVRKLKLKYAGISLPVISISAGIAVYPDNGSDSRSLIAAADIALYKAKLSGRDKVISALVH